MKFTSFGTNDDLGMKRNLEKTRTLDLTIRNKIGGNTKIQKLEDWINTVDLKNASIIEYTILREIYKFLDAEIREKLKEPLEIVEQKCIKRKIILIY